MSEVEMSTDKPEQPTELVRQAPAALAKLPYLPDVHDAVGGEQ